MARRLGGLVLWAALLLSGCGGDPQSPEEQVRATIVAAEQAAEQRSLSEFAELIDEHYSDKYNNDARAVKRTLLAYFHRNRTIHLFTRIASVELSPDQRSAKTVVYVAMTGSPVQAAEALFAMRHDLMRFEVEFVKRGGDWLIFFADWRRAKLEDFQHR